MRSFVKALTFAILALSTAARADDSGTAAPSFYIVTGVGYSVYKSALVQSNDTGVTTGYGFGCYAGKDHEIGLKLVREQSAFHFALNGSKVAVSWQDILLTYRLGLFHAGLAISSSAWKIAAPRDSDGDGQLDNGSTAVAQDLLDITTTGYGANTGFAMALSKKGGIYADATFVTTGTVQEKVVKDAAGTPRLGRVITVGPRTDLDVGGSLQLFRWLEARAGFKARSYLLSIDAKASKESLNTTYAGLVVGFGF